MDRRSEIGKFWHLKMCDKTSLPAVICVCVFLDYPVRTPHIDIGICESRSGGFCYTLSRTVVLHTENLFRSPSYPPMASAREKQHCDRFAHTRVQCCYVVFLQAFSVNPVLGDDCALQSIVQYF